MQNNQAFQIFHSPLGDMLIQVINQEITHCDFIEGKNKEKLQRILNQHQHHLKNVLLEKACCQLSEYFSGHLKTFDLALAPAGTEFQKKVWHALQKIPFAQTRNYAQIARQVKAAKAVRAVGGANGKNPIAIIIPCHRVIGSNGSLTGYAGGLERKKMLLSLEQRHK